MKRFKVNTVKAEDLDKSMLGKATTELTNCRSTTTPAFKSRGTVEINDSTTTSAFNVLMVNTRIDFLMLLVRSSHVCFAQV